MIPHVPSATVKLHVAAYPFEPIHRCMARMDPTAMRELGVEADALVEARSPAGCAVLLRLAPPSTAETDHSTLAIDRFARQALKVRIGDTVAVVPATERPAKNVVLAPAVDVSLVPEVKSHLQRTFAGARVPLSLGSILYSTFPGSVGGTTYRVVEVDDGPGVATESTGVELVPPDDHDAELPNDVTFDDVGGMDRQIRLVRELVELPLLHPQVYRTLGIEPPRGIIFHGPPGSGKTHLARAIANEVHARFFYINGPDIVGTSHGETEGNLRRLFAEAAHHAPSVVFIDEVDAVAPKRGETGSQSDTRMVTQLLALLDGLTRVDGVVVIGTTNRIDSLDTAIRRPGRFDREVLIGPPDANGRLQVLRIHAREMPLSMRAIEHLRRVADVTHGMVGADLMELCREAGLNAMRRRLPADSDGWQRTQVDLERLVVEPEDFDAALTRVRPSALRETVVTVPDTRWEDVAGLDDAKRRLRELVERPLTDPAAFAALHLRPPTGVLLYGPPGTGKTLLAKAVARQSGANFISVKGAEIFSKWLGESEEGVRQVFRLARQVSPAVVFFDQLDAIASNRGVEGMTKTAERVVNQLLAEMDGLEQLTKIAVIGATNRIDLLDPAILRPGRFGVHIEVPLPDAAARRDILALHLASVRVAEPRDATIDRVARETDGFSGAELEALCQEAKLAALRESGFRAIDELRPDHLASALATARAQRRLYL